MNDYIMKLFLQDNTVNETEGEPFYLTSIYESKINGYTDKSSDIMSYDSRLTFKTLLECFILQNKLKKIEVANELDLSRQLFNFKLNQDKFSRLELLKLKEVLNMSDDSFLLLVKAGA
jgi:hypothetical protein